MGSRVSCVAALPDGVHFVVGTGRRVDAYGRYSGEVRLYHVDGMLVHTFTGHTAQVLAVAVTPDGQHIISGALDRRFIVWSVATKSLVSTCGTRHNQDPNIGHTGYVWALAAMPDGQRFLSGGNDRAVRVWLLNGTLENTFSELHSGCVIALVALPDNQHALSGSHDFTIKLFNVDDGAVLRTFKHRTPLYCLALLPDGLRFVSGSGDFDDGTACVAYHGLAPQ